MNKVGECRLSSHSSLTSFLIEKMISLKEEKNFDLSFLLMNKKIRNI